MMLMNCNDWYVDGLDAMLYCSWNTVNCINNGAYTTGTPRRYERRKIFSARFLAVGQKLRGFECLF